MTFSSPTNKIKDGQVCVFFKTQRLVEPKTLKTTVECVAMVKCKVGDRTVQQTELTKFAISDKKKIKKNRARNNIRQANNICKAN